MFIIKERINMKNTLVAFFVFCTASQLLAQSLGLRDVNSTPYALESSTSVSRLEPTVRLMFNNMKGTFPKKGDLFELNDSYIVALTSYAGEFCKLMISRDMAKTPDKRWAHASVDFNIPPHNWTLENVNTLLNKYSELFWQRAVTNEEREVLQTGMGDLLTELPQTNKSSEGALLALCGIYISAPGFVFVGGQ